MLLLIYELVQIILVKGGILISCVQGFIESAYIIRMRGIANGK